ncbi:hypothetical protein J421_5811 (plasmid) [Gemmatirosa kalamazoonensis]|uniref:Uncharacterized protein n=1 Tax=Gemmatirosa kalamazoonensis TaxID=861299 RepID=W0RRM6_9BACT|nr:hypothetical protein [Gemmatirosa kalamazoonensis]AHG93346.1 hypothetical protein J421_5811 [Gemmatirosa kalamazoonensis]
MSDHQDALLLDRADAAESPERVDLTRRWTDPPTHKARAGVQRAVNRLLDILAPERTVIRAARPPQPVERHRTPRACILQSAAAAVSVSWFPDAASDAAFGELQVLVWRGTVSRPGSAQRGPGGATIVRALVFYCDDRGGALDDVAALDVDAIDVAEAQSVPADWGWCMADGTRYETDALAAHCLALLAQAVVDVAAGDSG